MTTPASERQQLGAGQGVPHVRVMLTPDACSVPSRRAGSAAEAAAIAHELIGRADREHLVVLLVDAQLGLLGVHTLAIGTQTDAPCDVAALFRVVLLAGAHGFMLAHNHAGGSLDLSHNDLELWRRVSSAAELLQVRAIDFLIVTPSGAWRSLSTSEGERIRLAKVNEAEAFASRGAERRAGLRRSPGERKAFLEALLAGADPSSLVAVPGFDGPPGPLRVLARRLWACTEPFPVDACAALGLKPGSTFAVASRRALGRWR